MRGGRCAVSERRRGATGVRSLGAPRASGRCEAARAARVRDPVSPAACGADDERRPRTATRSSARCSARSCRTSPAAARTWSCSTRTRARDARDRPPRRRGTTAAPDRGRGLRRQAVPVRDARDADRAERRLRQGSRLPGATLPVVGGKLGRTFVAATDEFVRVFMTTMAAVARRYGVYVVASNTQAPFKLTRNRGRGRRAPRSGDSGRRCGVRPDRWRCVRPDLPVGSA